MTGTDRSEPSEIGAICSPSVRAYLFDVDGTLSDPTHRLHHIQKQPKDWDAFFAACPDDAPHKHMCQLAATLLDADCTVIFVSGRSDRVRSETEEWIAKHVGYVPTLYMRADGDRRPDNIVKSELLDRIIADGFEPQLIFEDRDQVVRMWRQRGIPCAQVAEGDF